MMKKHNAKSFTFKVAQQESVKDKKQVKARDGVTLAGCTNTKVPWGGYEPTLDWLSGTGDGGLWC